MDRREMFQKIGMTLGAIAVGEGVVAEGVEARVDVVAPKALLVVTVDRGVLSQEDVQHLTACIRETAANIERPFIIVPRSVGIRVENM